ncbi:MAG: universal stress protein, partial [Chthoniobacterales bacterium]
RSEGVDLIITSTHGRSGVKRAFIGSTAEQIVRHAPCPVLVVPNRSAAKRPASGK